MKKINGLKKGLIYALVTTMIATSVIGTMPMDASAATTGKVNASTLNVRSGAGTGYSRVGSVTQGQTVTIVDSVKASDGYTWYKISGTTSGYVRGDYISNIVSDNVASKTGTITADFLNVRTGPGTNYSHMGYATNGTRATIISAHGDWYKVTCKIIVNNNVSNIAIRTGYVHSDYVKLDSSSNSSSGSSSSGSSNSGSSNTGSNSTDTVIATGVVNVSALNVRSGAGTGNSVIGVLGYKASVEILSQSGSWYKVRCTVNGSQKTGYVHSDYITKTATSNNNGTSQTTGQGVVNADALNVRSGAGTSNSVKDVIYLNTKVEIVSQIGNWYSIKYTKNGATKTGYVAAEYITKTTTVTPKPDETETTEPETQAPETEPETQAPTVTPEPENPVYESKNGVVNVDDLRVRSKASTSSSVLGFVDKGTKVTIIGEDGDWYKVKVVLNGTTKEGYLFAEYVTVQSEEGSGNGNNNDTTSNAGDRGTVAGNAVNLRTGPGTSYGSYGELAIGTPLYIKGKEGDWYKVSCIVKGILKEGYIYGDYVKINGIENLPYDGETDSSFEEQIAAFPDSYKNALRRLHDKYPKWTFKAVEIGLDFKTVIEEQNKENRSHVNITDFTPFSWLSTSNGDYDWATDTYTNRDGAGWKSASKELIAYYVDPRNFLDENQIFMFETQSYETSQNREIVASILEGTFMEDGKTYTYNGKTYSYVDTFMEAGKLTGVSPYFLASRCRAEVGGGSLSVTGTHGTYPGIYNFFNIGAFSSAEGNAIANGLYYASQTGKYQRPWTNPYLAIVGGAEFIADEYINDGQNTSYFQRFDILKAPYYTHQYMQSIQAPSSEASTRYGTYKELGVLTSDSTITFLIPVYENMPEEVAQMPTAEGNPNSYLKALSVSGVTLNNTFTYNKTDYTAVTSRSSITISATPVSQYATVISGTGTYTLKEGLNQFTVVCQAGNGDRTTYTLNIHRQ